MAVAAEQTRRRMLLLLEQRRQFRRPTPSEFHTIHTCHSPRLIMLGSGGAWRSAERVEFGERLVRLSSVAPSVRPKIWPSEISVLHTTLALDACGFHFRPCQWDRHTVGVRVICCFSNWRSTRTMITTSLLLINLRLPESSSASTQLSLCLLYHNFSHVTQSHSHRFFPFSSLAQLVPLHS